MLQNRLSTYFQKGNRGTWVLFGLFVVTLVGKCAFFRYSLHGENAVLDFQFYLSALSIALLIASFIFIFKRKYWILYVSGLLDMWMIANLWYFRSYRTLLDVFAITMVGNLNDGYWASIQLFTDGKDLVFPLITLVLGLSFLLFDNRNRASLIYTPLFWLMSVGLHSIHTNALRNLPNMWPEVLFNCFSNKQHTLLLPMEYENRYTIIHGLPKNINAYIHLKSGNNAASQSIGAADKALINSRLRDSDKHVQPDSKLVFILLESLESWGLNTFMMPKTSAFLAQEHILYIPQVAGQIAGGLSSDAQLLVNTGLLPIKSGAVSHLYADNLFPSIADMYATPTLSIASTQLDDCWHQWAMNQAYHFDVAWSKGSSDSLLFTAVKEAIHRFDYVQVFTISTHSPFTAYAEQSSLALPDGLPKMFADYMRSMHVLDAGLAELLSAVATDSILHDATIVVMGDHGVFPPDKLADYTQACEEYDLPFAVTTGGHVPLVIYSPKIAKRVVVPELCYQMDVYPTILPLIGCENYFWQGFGVNLLDSTARVNRTISHGQASDLSDKLIRADYFRELTDSLRIRIEETVVKEER